MSWVRCDYSTNQKALCSKAFQIVGSLAPSNPRPQGEIVCVIDVRVRQWAAWGWLGAPNASARFRGWLLGLRTRSDGPPVDFGKGLDLFQKGIHAATPRRILADNAAANNRASVHAKSNSWSNVRISCQSPDTSENRCTVRSKSGPLPRYAMRTNGPK